MSIIARQEHIRADVCNQHEIAYNLSAQILNK